MTAVTVASLITGAVIGSAAGYRAGLAMAVHRAHVSARRARRAAIMGSPR